MAQKSRATLSTDTDTNINDNTTKDITPLDVRTVLKDSFDSDFNLTDDDLDDIADGISFVKMTTAERTKVSNSITSVVEDTTPQAGGDFDFQGNDITAVDTIKLSTSPATALVEGALQYGSADKALLIRNSEADITLRVGQDQWVRVYNNSGATITKGKVVYVSGKEDTEDRFTIANGKADAESTSKILGVATHDIENSSFGFVQRYGYLKGLDTSAFSDGAPIWLDASTAGSFTATRPSPPNIIVFLGFVVDSHASTGSIFIDVAATSGDDVAAFGEQTQDYLDSVTVATWLNTTDNQATITALETETGWSNDKKVVSGSESIGQLHETEDYLYVKKYANGGSPSHEWVRASRRNSARFADFEVGFSGSDLSGWAQTSGDLTSITGFDGNSYPPVTAGDLVWNGTNTYFASDGTNEGKLDINNASSSIGTPGTGPFTHFMVIYFNNDNSDYHVVFQSAATETIKVLTTGIEIRMSGMTTETLSFTFAATKVYFIAVKRNASDKFEAWVSDGSTYMMQYLGVTTGSSNIDLAGINYIGLGENERYYLWGCINEDLPEYIVNDFYRLVKNNFTLG